MEMRTMAPWESIEPASPETGSEDPIPVLFIQDDPSVAEMYRIKLEVDGYQVTVIGPEELSVKTLATVHPELVFLDIRSPHVQRFRLLRKLHASRPTNQVPVVILSNYTAQELGKQGIRLHSGEYLIVNFTTPTSLSPSADAWAEMEFAWR